MSPQPLLPSQTDQHPPDRSSHPEQLRIIFDTMQAGIILVDPRGTITLANQRMASMLRIPLDRLIGTPYTSHLHPDNLAPGDTMMRRLISGEIDHVHHERRYLRQDGSDFWGHLSGRRHLDQDGNLISLVGVIADISEAKRAEEALRQRKKQFTSLAENLPDIVARLDRNHRHVYVSRQIEQVTGRPAAGFIGKSNRELGMPPDLVDQWERAVEHVFMTGTPREITFSFPGEDGTHYYESRIIPERGEDGTVETVLCIARDMSASRRAEQAIRESEERYRAIFENVQDVFYRADADGRLTMLSPSGADLLGYHDPSEMIGRSIGETFYHAPAERSAFIHNLKQKGRLSGYEVTLRHRDGSPIPVSTASHLLYHPDGTYAGVEGVFRDMRAHHETMARLTASEKKFSTIFRTSPDAIYISRLDDGTLLEVNEGFVALLGFTSGEVTGRSDASLGIWADSSDRERFSKMLKAQGSVKNFEARLRRSSGEEILALVSSSLVDIEGQSCVLSILRDISEREAVQQERIKVQKLESLGVLAGGIAHDFNNLLTGIIGNISIAAMLAGENHPVADRLRESQNAARRAAALTQQLLTFAKGGEPVRRAVDTRTLLEEVISFTLSGSNLRGELELDEGLWPIHADPDQMHQVLNNLLINARQAMAEGGTVRVRASNREVGPAEQLFPNPGAYVRITVEDTGCGIPADQLERIFDPYFTTKPQGTGLGMTSVFSIIRRHKGLVEIASREGSGTTVTLHLPAATGEMAGPSEHGRPQVHRGQGGRILIMDDEEVIRELAVVILEENGFRGESCGDGTAAVAAVARAREEGVPFDVVILDLTVPGGVGGREAAALIRRQDREVGLLVSSGYSSDPVVANYRDFGFDGIVSKPYDMNSLAAEVGRVLEKKRERAVTGRENG